MFEVDKKRHICILKWEETSTDNVKHFLFLDFHSDFHIETDMRYFPCKIWVMPFLTSNSEASVPFNLDVDAEVWPVWQPEDHLLCRTQRLPLLCYYAPFPLLLLTVSLIIFVFGEGLQMFYVSLKTTFMRVVLMYSSRQHSALIPLDKTFITLQLQI